MQEKRQSGLGIAGFVIGLISLVLFPLILGLIGTTLSGIALNDPETKHGLATAGLVLSIISIVFGIIKGFFFGIWL